VVKIASVSRKKISPEIWEQAKIAFASGSIGLRELARKMKIPQGTMTARASREGWTQNIAAARAATTDEQSVAVKPTVLQAVGESLQARGQRHVERFANISENVTAHIETMHPAITLASMDVVEKFDRMGAEDLRAG
jgi:hypothetical protein